MRTWIREGANTLAVASMALAALAVTAVPALAKMPPFDLEVSPERPAPGETVTVWVTIYQFGTETVRPLYEHGGRGEVMRDFPSDPLRNLVGVYPVAAFDEQRGWTPESDHDPLTLHRVAPGVYEGSFRAPEEGAVMVVPFPGHYAPYVRSTGGVFTFDEERAAELGYPMPVSVTVASGTPVASWWLVAPGLAVVFGVFATRRKGPFR